MHVYGKNVFVFYKYSLYILVRCKCIYIYIYTYIYIFLFTQNLYLCTKDLQFTKTAFARPLASSQEPHQHDMCYTHV